jgi:hypothetical protein
MQTAGPQQKFPVGPASARELSYDPQEIDALSPSLTESFCWEQALGGNQSA